MTMVINVVLIILFCYIALISYYSDKKNGIIPNKNLLVIGIIAVILKILDYKNIDIMIIQLVISCICSLLKELGDVAWYLAEAATALDISLEDILQANIDKLKMRYPDGFETKKSLVRLKGDI